MRWSELVALMLLCHMIVRAAEKLEPLNVKVGAWEMSYTVSATGQMPLSDEQLAQLTPDMRARMEQLWKGQNSKAAQTHTVKRCITEEDLKKSAFAGQRQELCAHCTGVFEHQAGCSRGVQVERWQENDNLPLAGVDPGKCNRRSGTGNERE